MLDNLEILLENAWSGRDAGEFENDIELRNAVTGYIEAAEELLLQLAKNPTDDFFLPDAIDTLQRKSHAVRMALGKA